MDRRDFARRMRVCFSGPPDSRRELDRHTATPATIPRQHLDDTFDSLARATSMCSKLRRCNRQRMAVAGRAGACPAASRLLEGGDGRARPSTAPAAAASRRSEARGAGAVQAREALLAPTAMTGGGGPTSESPHRLSVPAWRRRSRHSTVTVDSSATVERLLVTVDSSGHGERCYPRGLWEHTLPLTAKCKSHRQASSSSLPVPRHCRSCSGSTSIARGCLSLGFLELRVVQLAAADAVRARARNPALCRPSAVPGPGYRESASG